MLLYSKNIQIGWQAENFKLRSTKNELISLKDIKNKNGLVVAFICNHCPYVKDLIVRMVADFLSLSKLDFGSVAIMSNDYKKYKEDSFEKMQIFEKKYKFNFPYLLDTQQDVAKKYGAVCTPDFFCFDCDDKLFYRGRLDDIKFGEKRYKERNKELVNAVTEKIKKNKIVKNQKNSMGCSIKWKKAF